MNRLHNRWASSERTNEREKAFEGKLSLCVCVFAIRWTAGIIVAYTIAALRIISIYIYLSMVFYASVVDLRSHQKLVSLKPTLDLYSFLCVLVQLQQLFWMEECLFRCVQRPQTVKANKYGRTFWFFFVWGLRRLVTFHKRPVPHDECQSKWKPLFILSSDRRATSFISQNIKNKMNAKRKICKVNNNSVRHIVRIANVFSVWCSGNTSKWLLNDMRQWTLNTIFDDTLTASGRTSECLFSDANPTAKYIFFFVLK